MTRLLLLHDTNVIWQLTGSDKNILIGKNLCFLIGSVHRIDSKSGQNWDNGLMSHFGIASQSLSCCFEIDFQYWKYQRARIWTCKWKIPRLVNQIGWTEFLRWTLKLASTREFSHKMIKHEFEEKAESSWLWLKQICRLRWEKAKNRENNLDKRRQVLCKGCSGLRRIAGAGQARQKGKRGGEKTLGKKGF